MNGAFDTTMGIIAWASLHPGGGTTERMATRYQEKKGERVWKGVWTKGWKLESGR